MNEINNSEGMFRDGQQLSRDSLKDEFVFFTVCPECGNSVLRLSNHRLECLKCGYFPIQVINIREDPEE